MEVDKGIRLKEIEIKDFVNSGVKLKTKYEGCIRCLELHDKLTKSKDNCARLESDIGKKNSVIEWLEGKVCFMEHKKLKIEDEVRVLTQRKDELENRVRIGEEEDDKFTQLMIENKVLECEKNKAERDIEVWKAKCQGLEMQVLELEKRLSPGMMETGSLLQDETENKPNEEKGARVRKCLDFANERIPCKNVSPATPGARHPLGPIVISDSDDGKELTSKDRYTAVVEQQSDDEETTCYIERPQYTRRKRRRKVRRGFVSTVSSENESSSDDNIPICSLRSKNLPTRSSETLPNRVRHNVPKPRRRLVRVGDFENKGVLGKHTCENTGNESNLGIPEMNESVGEDEMEEDDSSREGESLGGFIVYSSDVSESNYTSNCDKISEDDGAFSGDCSSDSHKVSESSVAYPAVISGLRRERKDKMKWEYEADMLADFAKSPELCMKAVCALYRQQTSVEKSCKATIVINGRGFSQIHAFSGSALAEFLTDGDPYGDMKKSVEELQEFNPMGVEKCRKLATHYSKQLFEIYKNGEDPFLHP